MPRSSRVPESEPTAVRKPDAPTPAPVDPLDNEPDTDSVFLECARLGWSDHAKATWRRHRDVTLEANVRSLLGKPQPGDERFNLSDEIVLRQKAREAGLSDDAPLFPPEPIYSSDEMVEQAAYLREKGIL